MMGSNFIGRNLLILYLCHGALGSVKFYGDINFEGFFYESNANHREGCINLPHGNDQTSSINSDGVCVLLYEDRDCKGRELKIAPGVHSHNDLEKHDFNDKATSFKMCSPEEASRPIRHPQYGLYDDAWHRNLLVEYQEVCSCTNLPSFANDKVSSVNTHSNCIRLYEDRDCKGEMKELTVGSPGHGDLTELTFNDRTSSINVCGNVAACSKLNAVIKKIKFGSESLSDILRNAAPKKVELASASTFWNNASSPITRTYEGKRTYRETFEFEEVESLSKMHTVGVDLTLGVEGSVGIPFLAEGKVKTELKVGYQYQGTSSSESRKKWTSENTREFSVSETLTVPPCTVYQASSFMEVVENIPLPYDMLVKISGVNYGTPLKSQELRERLPPGMTYLKDESSTEILASTKGRILANFGVKSEVTTDSRRIENCQLRKRRHL